MQINGREHRHGRPQITHEEVLALAAFSGAPGAVIKWRPYQRGGSWEELAPGEAIALEGMACFSVARPNARRLSEGITPVR